MTFPHDITVFKSDYQDRVPSIRQNPVDDWRYTTCGYCSTGCGIEVGVRGGKAVTVRGKLGHPVNDGKLCLKGIWEFEAVNAPNRAEYPMLRTSIDQPFARATWDEAFTRTAAEFTRIQQKYGRDAVAVVSTGQIYTEEFYTLGKLVRGGLGTNNYDGNTTLCMASAVSGYKRSFGADGPPGCYDDFDHTECLLAFGSNLVECHPVIYWRLKSALERRRFPVIVIDPRVTMFAQMADIHLPITPGTDVVLLNALAHVVLEEGLADEAYVAAQTSGLAEWRKVIEQYSPEVAASVCGIPAERIREVARIYGRAGAAMCIWTMGINQSTHGSDGVVGINNLSLITGNVGRPGGSPLSITGQCNAMGTREFSSCSGLPGYRLLENPEHRGEIAAFWGVDEATFPQKRGRAMTDIFPAIEAGEIKALWLIATNPMTSMPDTHRVAQTLKKLEFLAIQDVFHPLPSAEFAHAFLPAAIWAEKEGTFTNSERRVNLVRKVVDPPGEAKSDLDIFLGLADAMSMTHLIARTPAQVMDEIGRVSEGRPCDYSGITHEALERAGGIQWPAPKADAGEAPQGSPRLYTDGGFHHADGRAKLIPLLFDDDNERPDTAYPFWLNTGRVVEHWHTRTKTGRIGNLNKFSPIPYVEMNSRDAARLGIESLDFAKIRSRRSELTVMAQLTERVAPGMVFIPFHYARGANLLTLGLLDPHSRQPAFKQQAVAVEKAERPTNLSQEV
ncbi:MAG: nitrate reductase [Nitrospirota bacterium]|nr:nitrate reductase [Nitrospirota bacterium]